MGLGFPPRDRTRLRSAGAWMAAIGGGRHRGKRRARRSGLCRACDHRTPRPCCRNGHQEGPAPSRSADPSYVLNLNGPSLTRALLTQACRTMKLLVIKPIAGKRRAPENTGGGPLAFTLLFEGLCPSSARGA